MKNKFIIAMFAVLALLIAYNNQTFDQGSEDMPAEDVKDLVNEYSAGHFSDEKAATITATELIITDQEDNESVYNLPEGEFFVSIAPFLTETHPCTDHSLTGCQGELAHKDFDVLIEDSGGNMIVDDTMNSGENGFIDLWLPRNQTYQVTITHEGKQVESDISTFVEDGTCITTMQLS